MTTFSSRYWLAALLAGTVFAAPDGAVPAGNVLWSVGTFDGTAREFPSDENRKAPLKLDAAKDDLAHCPWPNRTPGMMGSPTYLSVKFKIERAGKYTLQVALADAKPTPKNFLLWLDGKNIFTEPVRGAGGATEDNNLGYREHLILDLTAGEHTIGVGAESTEIRTPDSSRRPRASSIVLDALALSEGEHPLVYAASVRNEENWEAKSYSDPFESRWEARSFGVRLTDLGPGKYDLVLNFQEDEVFAAGRRVFDVSISGKRVFRDVDIFAEAGGVYKTLTKTTPVTVGPDGKLELGFQTTRGQRALLNELKVMRGKDVVFRRNCGFIPGTSPVFATPITLDGRTKGAELILGMENEDADNEAPAAAAEASPGAKKFTGVNIVANGDFEDAAKADGWPARWTPGLIVNSVGNPIKLIGLETNSYWKQGTGKIALDRDVKHGGQASVRLSATQGTFGLSEGKFPKGWVDFDRTEPYEVVLAVKGRDNGESELRVDWGSFVNHSKARYLGSKKFPLPRGTYDWKILRFSIVPPPGASSMSVAITSTDNPGTLWIDDVSVDGFGTRAVQVLASQGGYPAYGLKEALVFTREDLAGGTFVVSSAMDSRGAQRGSLEKMGFHAPVGRYVWRARFDTVTAADTYTLQATFPGSQAAASLPFPINDHVFGDIARLSFEYFRVIQANIAIPGWHGADHPDDGFARNERFSPKEPEAKSGPKINAIGNYYDAGDYSKKPMGAIVAVALAELDRIWRPSDQKYGLIPSDPLAVGIHGARFFKGAQRADGGFYSIVLRDGKKMGDPAGATEEQSGGMVLASRQPGLPYALARFAVLLHRRDPKLALDYAHAADRSLTPTIRYWNDFGGEAAAAYKRLVFAPLAAGAAINLHQLMPARGDLKQEADRRIREIAQLVDEKAFYDKHYWLNTISTHNGMDLCHEMGFALAMLDFVEAYPTDPLTPLVRKSLIGFIDGALLPSMATNPFGHLGEITAEGEKARSFLSPRYYDSTAYAAGHILARAAIAFDRPAWLAPAARQVFWGIGLNPRGVSFCMGVGTKNAATRTLLAGVPGHEDAKIPGGVNKGFEYASGRRGLAEGYPSFSGIHDVPRDGFTPAGQEYWKVISAYFLLATEELQKAHDHFRLKGTRLSATP
jgi:hypothetical protein